MPLVQLSVLTILDGSLIREFDDEVDRVSKDVITRPGIKKPRKVMLEVNITPEEDPNTRLNHPIISAIVKSSLPGFESMKIRGRVNQGQIEIINEEKEPLLSTLEER